MVTTLFSAVSNQTAITGLPFSVEVITVSLAFGFALMVMTYVVGPISGGHLNPAVSFGLWMGKRFPGGELVPYILAQVIGAVVAAGLLYLIASIDLGFEVTSPPPNPLGTTGYGNHSPNGYSWLASLGTEIGTTFLFLLVFLGVTTDRVPKRWAPVAIGLALTVIHLISMPVTYTSVNPARSTGPALIVGLNGNPELFAQVWLFWLAPIVGAVLAGFLYNAVSAHARPQ